MAQRTLTAQESKAWFEERLASCGYESLAALADEIGSNKGNLSRYFRQETIPSVVVFAQLCEALEAAPETLLVALGVHPKPKNWGTKKR